MARASANVAAPIGAIMNSCTSTLLSACAPPLRMFIIGTGSRWALGPPTYRNSGSPADSAGAPAHPGGRPGRAGRGAGDRVRSEPRLAGGSVEVAHRLVDEALLARVEAQE